MIKITLCAEALNRVRLNYSPMWEAVCSLRTLLHQPAHHLHAPWVKWARPRIEPGLVELLRGLMPSPGLFPDFLTPPTAGHPRSFQAELTALAESDPASAREQIERCWDGRPPAAISALLRNPETAMPRLSTAIEHYWSRVLSPVWDGLRSVLMADLAYRADEFAGAGLGHLLTRLHEKVSFDGENLMLASRYDVKRDAGANGVVLIPCVFAWPDVLIVDTEPYPVTVSYSPRGAGTLWQSRTASPAHSVASLMGRSRATILALLDLPLSTSQLAEQTNMSQPAVSQHLAVLRSCGLTEARRAGRMVLNTRTALGHALLNATDIAVPRDAGQA